MDIKQHKETQTTTIYEVSIDKQDLISFIYSRSDDIKLKQHDEYQWLGHNLEVSYIESIDETYTSIEDFLMLKVTIGVIKKDFQ